MYKNVIRKEMKTISHPASVRQICMSLSDFIHSGDAKTTIVSKFGSQLSGKSTTGSIKLDKYLHQFVDRLSKEKSLRFYVSAFLAYYFSIKGDVVLNQLFSDFYSSFDQNDYIIQPKDAAFISGFFLAIMLKDDEIEVKQTTDIPENVFHAVEYIESEGFSVLITKT